MGSSNSAALAKLRAYERLYGPNDKRTKTQKLIVEESQAACPHDGFFLLQGDDRSKSVCARCSKVTTPPEGYVDTPILTPPGVA